MKHLYLSFTVNLSYQQIKKFQSEHNLASTAYGFSNTMFKLHHFCHFLNRYTGTCILLKRMQILVGFVIKISQFTYTCSSHHLRMIISGHLVI